MNAYTIAAREAGRFSAAIRADHPEGEEPPHPRARELSETMREAFAAGRGVTFRDLVGAGFTAAEIIEHGDAAEKLATRLSERHVTPRGDLLADMAIKAREAVPSLPPAPAGTVESQALFIAWGRYCAARSAFRLDAWDGQRERCMSLLAAYLRLTPAGAAVSRHVADSVDTLLRSATATKVGPVQ